MEATGDDVGHRCFGADASLVISHCTELTSPPFHLPRAPAMRAD